MVGRPNIGNWGASSHHPRGGTTKLPWWTLHPETRAYWILAVKVSLVVHQEEAVLGACAKKWQGINNKIPSWKKLGITDVEHQIRINKCHLISPIWDSTHDKQLTMDRFFKHKQPHPSSIMASLTLSLLLATHRNIVPLVWYQRGSALYGCTA